MLDHIRDLYVHIEWADARVWREVRRARGCSDDDAILDLLAHLHMTQHAFLDVWMGRSVQQRDARGEFDGAEGLYAWARTFHPEAGKFLEKLDPGRLAQKCQLPWAQYFREAIGREPAESTLAETLLQVALHSAHHRGQVVRQVRSLGGQPPIVDFIAWIWMGRPAPVWSEER